MNKNEALEAITTAMVSMNFCDDEGDVLGAACARERYNEAYDAAVAAGASESDVIAAEQEAFFRG